MSNNIYMIRVFPENGTSYPVGVTRDKEKADELKTEKGLIVVTLFMPEKRSQIEEYLSNNIHLMVVSGIVYAILSLLESITGKNAWGEYFEAQEASVTKSIEIMGAIGLKYLKELPDSLFS